MIQVQGLKKQLGGRLLFSHLNFVWPEPEIICITGANGTGKTTLLSLLAGVISSDAGHIQLLGNDLQHQKNKALQQLSYLPDNCPVYDFITGREWLAFVRSISAFDTSLEQHLLNGFGLIPHLDCQFKNMSLGTARKFLLTSSLVWYTPIIILDEPSNGLDSRSFTFLCQHLQERAQASLIVLSCLDPHQQTQIATRVIDLMTLEQS